MGDICARTEKWQEEEEEEEGTRGEGEEGVGVSS
jgi:hypothetical protein